MDYVKSLLTLNTIIKPYKVNTMTIPDNSTTNSGSLSKGVKNALLTMLIAVGIISAAKLGFEFGHWLRWY